MINLLAQNGKLGRYFRTSTYIFGTKGPDIQFPSIDSVSVSTLKRE